MSIDDPEYLEEALNDCYEVRDMVEGKGQRQTTLNTGRDREGREGRKEETRREGGGNKWRTTWLTLSLSPSLSLFLLSLSPLQTCGS
jgi:hypothetical protein